MHTVNLLLYSVAGAQNLNVGISLTSMWRKVMEYKATDLRGNFREF